MRLQTFIPILKRKITDYQMLIDRCTYHSGFANPRHTEHTDDFNSRSLLVKEYTYRKDELQKILDLLEA